uniref:(northern house mosquito) hypothetical protein n=1 Tax=Culex pipiens TaxID=7175 RepID=A0A8D8CST5_CULPI
MLSIERDRPSPGDFSRFVVSKTSPVFSTTTGAYPGCSSAIVDDSGAMFLAFSHSNRRRVNFREMPSNLMNPLVVCTTSSFLGASVLTSAFSFDRPASPVVLCSSTGLGFLAIAPVALFSCRLTDEASLTCEDWVLYGGALLPALICFHSESFFWNSSGKSLAFGNCVSPCPSSLICPVFHSCQSVTGFFFGSVSESLDALVDGSFFGCGGWCLIRHSSSFFLKSGERFSSPINGCCSRFGLVGASSLSSWFIGLLLSSSVAGRIRSHSCCFASNSRCSFFCSSM